MQTLKSLYQFDAILAKIPTAECYLSTLLGNIEIAHQPHRPVTMAQDYLRELRKLTASIADEKLRRGSDGILVHVDVDHVQLVVEWYCISYASLSVQSTVVLLYDLFSEISRSFVYLCRAVMAGNVRLVCHVRPQSSTSETGLPPHTLHCCILPAKLH